MRAEVDELRCVVITSYSSLAQPVILTNDKLDLPTPCLPIIMYIMYHITHYNIYDFCDLSDYVARSSTLETESRVEAIREAIRTRQQRVREKQMAESFRNHSRYSLPSNHSLRAIIRCVLF